MQKYKVAGYIRLSKEDKIKDESNSVTNQKAIIESYIKKNEDLELVDFYIDNGYSGTAFDRPEYKRMFKEILLGKSRKEIAEHLNSKNVLTPSLYKLSKENTNNEELICFKKWNTEIVIRILRSKTYTGTLIQNIKTKPNYRIDKLINVNKDEWIITENHHEQ